MTTRALVIAIALVTTAAAAPQQPQIQNAKIEPRQTTAFERDVAALTASATDPVWIAWREPIIDGEHNLCCTYSSDDGWMNGAVLIRGCAIDPVTPGAGTRRPDIAPPTGPVKLEGGTGLVLLVRAIDHHVERLRSLSDDCPMDAGGRTVYWFDNVPAKDSVTYLQSLMHVADGTRANLTSLSNSAISAIAWHRDPVATDVLLPLAHSPNDTQVRTQVLRSLGRRAGTRVVAELMAAIEQDPDANIRSAALDGLARLPNDDSVPRLIDLVKTTKDAAVRKKTMTLLGQTNDPRAIAFFQEILKR
jgi:hypothetical protein